MRLYLHHKKCVLKGRPSIIILTSVAQLLARRIVGPCSIAGRTNLDNNLFRIVSSLGVRIVYRNKFRSSGNGFGCGIHGTVNLIISDQVILFCIDIPKVKIYQVSDERMTEYIYFKRKASRGFENQTAEVEPRIPQAICIRCKHENVT